MSEAVESEIVGNFKIEIFHDDDTMSPREWDNLGHMVCWHNGYTLGDEQRTDYQEDWIRELAMELDPHLEDKIDYWEDEGFDKLVVMLKNRLISKFGSEDLLVHEDITENRNIASKMSEEYQLRAINRVMDRHIAVMLPLSLYDHGGITMSVGSGRGWDRGQVGWIYVTKEEVRKEYGWKKLTNKRVEKIETYLKGEVETYDRYLTGQVYGFVVTEHGTCKHCGADLEADTDSCWGHFMDSDDLLKDIKEEVKGYESELDCECSRYKALLGAINEDNDLFDTVDMCEGRNLALASRIDARMGGI